MMYECNTCGRLYNIKPKECFVCKRKTFKEIKHDTK